MRGDLVRIGSEGGAILDKARGIRIVLAVLIIIIGIVMFLYGVTNQQYRGKSICVFGNGPPPYFCGEITASFFALVDFSLFGGLIVLVAGIVILTLEVSGKS